jgi:hypothetical protein
LLHVFLCESGAVKNTTDECVRSCFPLTLVLPSHRTVCVTKHDMPILSFGANCVGSSSGIICPMSWCV